MAPQTRRRPLFVLALVLAALVVVPACGSSSRTAESGPTTSQVHRSGDPCTPGGSQITAPVPENLNTSLQSLDRFTTPGVKPLDRIEVSKLGLLEPGTLTVGTLSDAPPSICRTAEGTFTGFDNELLKAVAAKLGLKVKFIGTEFGGLLAQVADHRYDMASSSVTATENRRRTVGFTNGYDFGYLALVAPKDGTVRSFSTLTGGQRIGVVQGTVQDDFVTHTLKLKPVEFPDYATAYADLKSGRIDGWVAPSEQARSLVQSDDGTAVVEHAVSVNNFVGWVTRRGDQPLIDALNSGLDAVIADGTWAKLYTDWVPRELPTGWKPGSRAAPLPGGS